jgi:hypothetical protein
MPQVKMVNPAGHLLLVNGGKKMRKRKPATTPKRRKRNPSAAKTRKVSIKVNGRKRYTAKRRNPSTLAGMGLISDAFYAAAGGLLTAFVRGMVPLSFGGQLGDTAIQAGIAIGLGELTGRFWNRNAGKMVTLGGVTVAATNLLSGYGITPQALFSPKPVVKAVPAGANAQGMGDIGLFQRFGNPDPYYGSGVKLQGMGDIALRPR